MNHEFVKHILTDDRSDLSTTLIFNFEIGGASVEYSFRKFQGADFQGGTGKSHDQNFQNKSIKGSKDFAKKLKAVATAIGKHVARS